MSDKKIVLSLAVFMICLWSLFFSGTFYASDEIVIARLTQSITDHGRLTFSSVFGKTTSEYGILNSIVGIPPYAAYRLIANLIGAGSLTPTWNICALSTILLSGFAVVVFYYIMRLLGYSMRVRLFFSVLLGTTTQLFFYSTTFFSEPLFTLLLLLSLYFVVKAEKKGPLFSSILLGGICFGASLLSRINGLFFLPAMILFIITAGYKQKLKYGALFLLPVAAALIINLIMNLTMRGGLFTTGYGSNTFSGHYLSGLFGLLASPGRGFFVYNPWAFAAVAGFPLFYKRHPRVALLSLSLVLILVISYARFWTWHGGWTPGCRFLLPITPLVLVWALPLFEDAPQNDAYITFWRGIALALFVLSFFLQVLMNLVNPLDYNNELYGLLGAESLFLFIPQTSSLAGLCHLIKDGKFNLAITNVAPAYRLIIVLIYLILLVVILITGRSLWRSITSREISGKIEIKKYLNRFKFTVALIALFLVCGAFCTSLAGPRGLIRITSRGETTIDKRLRMEKRMVSDGEDFYTWSGYLEAPTEKEFTFYLKVLGEYEVRIGEHLLFYNDEKIPQHLPRAKIGLTYGIHPIRIKYNPYRDERAVFYMYWTIPGEARFIEPIGSDYLFPEKPTTRQRMFTYIKRHLWLIALTVLLPVAAIEYLYHVRHRLSS